MWLRFMLTVSCIVLCNARLIAQPTPTYRAVFSSDGPFFTSCEYQTHVPEYTHVAILWDEDHNGPGGYDQIPFTDIGYPEGMFGNFYDFYTETDGAFDSPVFEGSYMYRQPEPFYLVLEHGDSIITRWTSPVIALFPVQSESDPPQSVVLPANLWSCDTVSQAIECETDPPYVVIGWHHSLPEPFCVRTCRNGLTQLYIWHSDDSLDPTVVPIVRIDNGCEGLLPASFAYDPIEWSFVFDSWDVAIGGEEFGWYSVTFLEEAPAGVIDSFEAVRGSEIVSLRWTTSRETDIDHFELWSYHTDFRYWLRHLGDFDGAGQPAEYYFVDNDPRPASGYIWYCLIMVAGDSARWPARRAFVPRPMPVDDPAPVIDNTSVRAYPNPFNATTQIEFDLPASGKVRLDVFDINGRLVTTLVNGSLPPGRHTMTFDGHDLASGLYFARLSSADFRSTHKMVLLK